MVLVQCFFFQKSVGNGSTFNFQKCSKNTPKIFAPSARFLDNFTMFLDVCLLFSLAKIVVVAVFPSKFSRLRRFDSYFKMQKPLKASIENHTGTDLNCAVFRPPGIVGSGGNSK